MEAAPQLLSKLQRILVPWSVGFSIQDGAVSVVHVALSGLITERTGLFYLAIEILKGEMVSWLSVLGTCYLGPQCGPLHSIPLLSSDIELLSIPITIKDNQSISNGRRCFSQNIHSKSQVRNYGRSCVDEERA